MNTTEFEAKKTALIVGLTDVAKDIWHNATLLHVACDVAKGDEGLFDDFLREAVENLFEELRDLARSYGFDFTFAQYGRSGATIAPVEITIEELDKFVGIDTSRIGSPICVYNPDGSRDEEEEEIIKHERILTFLQEMNLLIDKERRKLPDEWRGFEFSVNAAVDPVNYLTLIIDQEGGVIQGIYLSRDTPLNVVVWDREEGPKVLTPGSIHDFPEEDLMLVNQALIAHYESQEER